MHPAIDPAFKLIWAVGSRDKYTVKTLLTDPEYKFYNVEPLQKSAKYWAKLYNLTKTIERIDNRVIADLQAAVGDKLCYDVIHKIVTEYL